MFTVPSLLTVPCPAIWVALEDETKTCPTRPPEVSLPLTAPMAPELVMVTLVSAPKELPLLMVPFTVLLSETTVTLVVVTDEVPTSPPLAPMAAVTAPVAVESVIAMLDLESVDDPVLT